MPLHRALDNKNIEIVYYLKKICNQDISQFAQVCINS